jgi:hypothetical protein
VRPHDIRVRAAERRAAGFVEGGGQRTNHDGGVARRVSDVISGRPVAGWSIALRTRGGTQRN